MEYVYAALLLHEADAEINEDNLTDILDAAGVSVEESRVKALVAALEDVDIEDALEEAAAVPAAGAGAGGAAGGEADETMPEAADEDEGEAAEEAEEADEAGDDEEDEDVSGEGLGDLFG